MISNVRIAEDGNPFLENFAAELTSAAYPVALRQGLGGSWLKLELGLWRALAETVEKWSRELPPDGSPDEFAVWRESFLADLTKAAFCIALKQEIKGSLLKTELGLYRVFRSMIGRVGQETLRRDTQGGANDGEAKSQWEGSGR
jgi:hypothetical protein